MSSQTIKRLEEISEECLALAKKLAVENKSSSIRGGKLKSSKRHQIKAPQSELKARTSKVNGLKGMSSWHDFYRSVSDLPLFYRFPRKKRVCISLFHQGLKKHNKTVEEMTAYFEDIEYISFEDYRDYMKLDHISYVRSQK